MSPMDVAAVVPWVFAIAGGLWIARLAVRAAAHADTRPVLVQWARWNLVVAVLGMVSLAVHTTDLGMVLAGCYVAIVGVDVAVVRPVARWRHGRCGLSPGATGSSDARPEVA